MTLPWDDLHPEPPKPITEPPPVIASEPIPPTPNLPDVTVPTIDFGKVLTEAFVQALRQAAPQVKDTATGYVKETVRHVVHGDEVEWGHPTITATTSQGKELVVADAKNRSWRTLIQGLCVDILYALIAAVGTLTGLDPFAKTTWIVFAGLVIKTIIQSAVSYFARLQITPTVREKGEKVALVPFAVAVPPPNK